MRILELSIASAKNCYDAYCKGVEEFSGICVDWQDLPPASQNGWHHVAETRGDNTTAVCAEVTHDANLFAEMVESEVAEDIIALRAKVAQLKEHADKAEAELKSDRIDAVSIIVENVQLRADLAAASEREHRYKEEPGVLRSLLQDARALIEDSKELKAVDRAASKAKKV